MGWRHQTQIMPTLQDLALYGPLIQVGAIVVSAIGVTGTIFWNMRIARRRATLDLLVNEQTHETTIKERTAFEAIVEGGDLLQWIAPASIKSDPAKLQTIRSSLNRYELIAIGIKGRALDGKLYKQWFRAGFVGDWIAFKALIVHVREDVGNPRLYCEFEWLAKKWADKTQKPRV
jgi:Domain of unknown function (DUF4760)